MGQIAEALQRAGLKTSTVRLRDVVATIAGLSSAEWQQHTGAGDTPERDRIQRRLMQVAKEAIKASPRNWDGAKDAFYAAVRKDPELLWELFAPYRAQAAQLWLTHAAAAMREEERPRLVTAEGARGQGAYDSQRIAAPRELAERFQFGADALAKVTTLSLLDTFKANGRPIGDMTPKEADAWAGSRERDARFVRLLTQNLPPDQPIRKFRTGEDAAALYAEAENV